MRRVAGIDVGGTFTDLLLYEAEAGEVGTIRLAKIPTTADNQAHGVLAAIAATGCAPADLDLSSMARQPRPMRCWSASWRGSG